MGRVEDDIGTAKGGLADWNAMHQVEKKKEMERHVDEVIGNAAHGTNIDSGSTWPTAEYAEI
ncbi:unnamed protein product, partial [Didymodactylos carnosus]